jgi:hypothetical protein
LGKISEKEVLNGILGNANAFPDAGLFKTAIRKHACKLEELTIDTFL